MRECVYVSVCERDQLDTLWLQPSAREKESESESASASASESESESESESK